MSSEAANEASAAAGRDSCTGLAEPTARCSRRAVGDASAIPAARRARVPSSTAGSRTTPRRGRNGGDPPPTTARPRAAARGVGSRRCVRATRPPGSVARPGWAVRHSACPLISGRDEPTVEPSFGQTIGDARRRAGLSQRELAARIRKEDGEPISPQYLNDLERDRRNPPGQPLLRQLARELDLPEEYLDFTAGQLPADLRADSYSPDQVAAAFR
ncbi:MAG: helix-turn-helix transcriptional regulator, partial [Chloroflexi bacterium]|nr:helix-turn-helix transcriptional regulator [Chloroflexota bacterium]